MGLVKRAADLAYTFRFIRLMAMDWKSWDAYKLGIIDPAKVTRSALQNATSIAGMILTTECIIVNN